jgi:hypothetical protein
MDKFNPKMSKEPRFSKIVIAPTKGVSPSATNDNVIQQRGIHRRSPLAELPSQLIRSTWRWIAAGVVV